MGLLCIILVAFNCEKLKKNVFLPKISIKVKRFRPIVHYFGCIQL